LAERAVAAQHRRTADFQVDVAGAELDGAPQKRIQFHACPQSAGAAVFFTYAAR